MLEPAYSATSPGTRRRGQQGSALIPSPTASPQRAKGPNHYGSTKQPTECQPWVALKEENFVIVLHSSGTRYIYANARKTAKSPFPTNLVPKTLLEPLPSSCRPVSEARDASLNSSRRTGWNVREVTAPQGHRITDRRAALHQLGPGRFEARFIKKRPQCSRTSLSKLCFPPHMPANLTNTIRNTNTKGPHHEKPQSEPALRLDRNSSPSSLPPRAGGGYSDHLSVTDSCLKHNPLKGSGSWEGQVSHTLHSSASSLPKRDPFALPAHLQDNCGKRETRKKKKRGGR